MLRAMRADQNDHELPISAAGHYYHGTMVRLISVYQISTLTVDGPGTAPFVWQNILTPCYGVERLLRLSPAMYRPCLAPGLPLSGETPDRDDWKSAQPPHTKVKGDHVIRLLCACCMLDQT